MDRRSSGVELTGTLLANGGELLMLIKDPAQDTPSLPKLLDA